MVPTFWQLKPFVPTPQTLALECKLLREGDLLRAFFTLSGEVDKIKTPAGVSGAGRRDELWKTTCFELFFSTAWNPGYLEMNFSPRGDWNCYAFTAYRAGMREKEIISPPRIVSQSGAGFFQLSAAIDLSHVYAPVTALEISATAVIETLDGALSYWAVQHAGAQPDFHLRESFAIRI